MANKFNFSPFSNKRDKNDPYNSVKTRDVYNRQQLERGELGKVKGLRLRQVLGVSVAIGLLIAFWFALSIVQLMMGQLGGMFGQPRAASDGLGYYLLRFDLLKVLFVLVADGIISGVVWAKLWRNYAVQNAKYDTTDINQYDNDQHIALPEEVFEQYDFFPDVGAHASAHVSSLISHGMADNKGIDEVMVAQFYSQKDEAESDGEVKYGELKETDDGDIIFKQMPFFDKKFGKALFETAGIDDSLKRYQKYWDLRKIPYNPENKRRDNRLQKKGIVYKTVADLVNEDWEMPYYEPQRPAGFYLIDSRPVNTMV